MSLTSSELKQDSDTLFSVVSVLNRSFQDAILLDCGLAKYLVQFFLRNSFHQSNLHPWTEYSIKYLNFNLNQWSGLPRT